MVMTHDAALPPLCEEEEEEGPTEDELTAGRVVPTMLDKAARIGCMLSRRHVGLGLLRSSSCTWPALTAAARASDSFALTIEREASSS